MSPEALDGLRALLAGLCSEDRAVLLADLEGEPTAAPVATRLVDAQELARLLGASVTSIRRMTKAGTIPSVVVGQGRAKPRRRYEPEVVRAALATPTRPAPSASPMPAAPPPRRHRRRASDVELLPIKGAPVRELLPRPLPKRPT
jgi:hypothetical protein